MSSCRLVVVVLHVFMQTSIVLGIDIVLNRKQILSNGQIHLTGRGTTQTILFIGIIVVVVAVVVVVVVTLVMIRCRHHRLFYTRVCVDSGCPMYIFTTATTPIEFDC